MILWEVVEVSDPWNSHPCTDEHVTFVAVCEGDPTELQGQKLQIICEICSKFHPLRQWAEVGCKQADAEEEHEYWHELDIFIQ